MESTIRVLKDELQGIRGNRASTALVENVIVDYYGQAVRLRDLANISTPEALQILIRPYDNTAVQEIEKALQRDESLGIHPNVDGSTIRLNVPALTRDRREELVKHVDKRLEDARVAIRNIRRSANDDLKDFEKEKEISEDERRNGEAKVQKLTDDHIAKIDNMGKEKKNDLMEI